MTDAEAAEQFDALGHICILARLSGDSIEVGGRTFRIAREPRRGATTA
jgi:hypothetical protein